MDTARYVLAVMLVVSLPPAVTYWFIFHPFAGFWRRRGRLVAFGAQAAMFVAMIAGLYLLREQLVVGDLGTRSWLIVASVPFWIATLVISLARRKHLTTKILVGTPEVDPDAYPGTLLQEGIYSRIRHPRYVEIILGVIAWALMINYVAVYVVGALTFLAIFAIVPMEERELEQRFGQAYRDYRSRVPRFFPRLGRSSPRETM